MLPTLASRIPMFLCPMHGELIYFVTHVVLASSLPPRGIAGARICARTPANGGATHVYT